VKVGTPFGEYPYVFSRLEKREDGLAIVGSVAGIDSTVVLETRDARALAKAAALPLVIGALVWALSRSRG
jgi:hypothetical protein